ncbi:MAG: hypothetical protein ACRDGI_00040 [Candidatus Limnocylindrales bacterium]
MTGIAPPTYDRPAADGALEQQALRLWPGLDADELAHCGGDPGQIAELIAQHANLTIDEVTVTLVRPDRGEPPFYFG